MLRCVSRPLLIGLPLFALVVAGVNLIAVPAPADDKPDKEPPKTIKVDLGGDVKMEFVLIPKGKFTMGSPKDEEKRYKSEDQHEVDITKPFYLAKYPVTQEQYLAIAGENPSHFCKDGKGADEVKDLDTKQFPVEMVSWDDAQVFCKKLTENDKEKRKFRLPTSAEWEYACRAGTTTPFYFGSELNGKQANCDGTKPYGTTDAGPRKGRTTKVGEYGENKWGLCDMHGNVWQWCEDSAGPREVMDYRRLDGGSWKSPAGQCRAACRSVARPNERGINVGFRVAFRLD